jgi:hypothetical protein
MVQSFVCLIASRERGSLTLPKVKVESEMTGEAEENSIIPRI